MLWTIRRKLLAISLLAIAFLLAVGGTCAVGAQQAPSSASTRQSALSDHRHQGAGLVQYQENASRAGV